MDWNMIWQLIDPKLLIVVAVCWVIGYVLKQTPRVPNWGIVIGAVAMRFGNRKLRQQQSLQYELEKNKAELEEYREELVSHFARSAELLDNMATDYRQLYQHMAKSSSSLLPEMTAETNPFRNRLADSEAGNDQAPVQMPRDYSDGASGLLRGGVKRD